MGYTIKQLSHAQDEIREAGRHVAEVVSNFAGDNCQWGTQRLEYLTQALSHLNQAWSLTRAATNDYPTCPSVRSIQPARIPAD